MENLDNFKTENEIEPVSKIDKEDMGLLKLMMEVDRNEKVTREEVMKSLTYQNYPFNKSV
jgi:hypothetical protein